MKTIFYFCIALILSFAAPSFADDFDVFERTYLKYLLSDKVQEQKIALRMIYGGNVNNPKIYDVVAEQFFNNIQKDNMDADTYAWFVKTLGYSGNGKYLAVINSTYKNVLDRKKIGKYQKKAQANMKDYKGVKYKKGDTNLNILKESLQKNRGLSPNNKEFKYETLASLALCTSSEQIIRHFGIPSKTSYMMQGKGINVGMGVFAKYYFGIIQILFEYENKAKLVLRRKKDGDWCFLKSMPLLPWIDPGDSKEQRAASKVRRHAWSWQHHSLDRAAVITNKFSSNIEILDEIAFRIWWGRNEDDAYAVEGIIVLIESLIRSKNPRYINLMVDLKENAGTGKIRRKCASYVKKIGVYKNRDIEQFDIKNKIKMLDM